MERRSFLAVYRFHLCVPDESQEKRNKPLPMSGRKTSIASF